MKYLHVCLIIANTALDHCLKVITTIFTDLPIWLSSWSSGNAFISGAGGLRFKSRAGQITRSVANGSPLLRHFFKWSCVAQAQ